MYMITSPISYMFFLNETSYNYKTSEENKIATNQRVKCDETRQDESKRE